MDATCVIVGDEILAGHVHDANSHFIAGRLAATGHRLRRVTVVADEPDHIRDAVRADAATFDPAFGQRGYATTCWAATGLRRWPWFRQGRSSCLAAVP